MSLSGDRDFPLADTCILMRRLDLCLLMMLGCALPIAGNGCSNSMGSSRDAATPNDAPTSTGGFGTGGVLGTGGGSAGASGQGGGGTMSGTGGTPGSGGVTGTGGAGGMGTGGTTGHGGSVGGGDGGVAGSGGKSGTGGTGSGGAGGSGGGMGPVCPGFAPWPAGSKVCRTVSDCPSPYNACQPMPVPDDCPAECQPDPPRECSSATACGTGNVCQGEYVHCCYNLKWFCAAACTATSCPADQRCGPYGECEPTPCNAGYTCPSDMKCPSNVSTYPDQNHGCVPLHCTEGYTCPVYATCGGPGVGGHGCVGLPCSTDGDCPCGVCIGPGATTKGACAGRLNLCSITGAGGASGDSGGGHGGAGGLGVDSGFAIDGG
jgi:hypothetical protein